MYQNYTLYYIIYIIIYTYHRRTNYIDFREYWSQNYIIIIVIKSNIILSVYENILINYGLCTKII